MQRVTLPTNPDAPANSTRRPERTWETFSSLWTEGGLIGTVLRILHVHHHGGRDTQETDGGVATHEATRFFYRFGEGVGAIPPEQGRDVVVLRAGDDDLARVLAAILAPVPHVEGVNAVVGVAFAVEVHV